MKELLEAFEGYRMEAFKMLEKALRTTPIPDKGLGKPRLASPDEFDLMNPENSISGMGDDYYQFKHSVTRNYVFVNKKTGELVVPKTNRPFFKGDFSTTAGQAGPDSNLVKDLEKTLNKAIDHIESLGDIISKARRGHLVDVELIELNANAIMTYMSAIRRAVKW